MNVTGRSEPGEHFSIAHEVLGPVELEISVVDNPDAVSTYLRRKSIHLLIYDERGENSKSASFVIRQIQKQVSEISGMWGPDFIFPMSRVVAILKKGDEQIFKLGRLNIHDVCISPASTTALLLWLKGVLTKGEFRKQRLGFALSGGGLDGFLYQLGVVRALEKCFPGADFAKGTAVSGVSSGAISGSLIATRVNTLELIRSLHKKSTLYPQIRPSTVFDVASTHLAKRSFISTKNFWLSGFSDSWLEKLSKTIPLGFIKGDRLEAYFRKIFELSGSDDHFSSLDCDFFVGATDVDKFEHTMIGSKREKNILISEAVRASMALPPVFTPKQIGDRWFSDGQVTKTVNLEVLIASQCTTVIVINPLKPVGSMQAGTTESMGGLYNLVQTLKALISTRFEATLHHVTERYPRVDFVVFEPDEECAAYMRGSPMRYNIRTKIVEMAYTSALKRILERHSLYGDKLAKCGYKIASVQEISEHLSRPYDSL